MRSRATRLWAIGLVVALGAAACSDDDDAGGETTVAEPEPSATDAAPETAAEPAATDATPATEAPTTAADPTTTVAPLAEDRSYYVLPPGNYGGIPTGPHSLDQLPLYDGLTPLRGDVTDADIDQLFLTQDLEPIGATTPEPIDRPGTSVVYDEWGVAHVTGETREDLAFGAGWVTARDRSLLVDFGRGAARAAVADIPGIDAFELVQSGQVFEPSAGTEQLVTDQLDLLVETYGEEGEEIVADATAYTEGMNAYVRANGGEPDYDANDVVAATALIGSIFGAGGGSEAVNAEYLSRLQNALGGEQGRAAWEDTMLFDDPEAPTTLDEPFDYPVLTGGDVTGSVVIDEGSIVSFDPREAASPFEVQGAAYPAAGAPPDRQASNWLIVDPAQSANGTSLAVMGPQLGYYYPEIVQQIHLTGPGIDAQGAAVPLLAMYILIGRTADYAWSLTSASHDVRDVFAEVLCNPDGSEPTRASTHYLHGGECVPFEDFDAGTLNGQPIAYPVSVHGPVIGTALSEGRPVALTRQRSTFGRDGLNLAALKDMTEGDAATAEDFLDVADKFGFTFNWGYANRDEIAYFSSGRLPVRAAGLDRRLPTLGTGEYEWQGFLEADEHPQAIGHPTGRLLNWNNQSAPGFMHGDGTAYGSVHRVELFDQWPEPVDLAGVVSVMNRSATEDTRSPVWPVISEVLSGSEAPSALAGEVVELLDDWVARDAPRLDADADGFHDDPGPMILDALFDPLVVAALSPVLGDLAAATEGISPESILDKDLRTLLGGEVDGPFRLQYCGAGDLDACRDALWSTVDEVAATLAAENGDDPSGWLSEGELVGFGPGLIPDTFRATNRPTFQQLLELAPS